MNGIFGQINLWDMATGLETLTLSGLGMPEEAIAFSPDGQRLATAGWNRLVRVWDAEAAYRQAIALTPDDAEAYYNLGNALYDQGQYAAAEAAYRQAIALTPDDAEAYYNLGNALYDQGEDAAAEAAYRQAITLKTVYDTEANYNLGGVLHNQGKYAAAEAAYRQAIAVKTADAEAYNNLGGALGRQGEPVEAEAAYRQVIAVKADCAAAHCNLGLVLQRQGRFTESLAAYRRGHELGSKRSGRRDPSLRWIRRAERLIEVAKKLPAVLQGEAWPANPGEAVTLAGMCQRPYKKRYAASARLYADAFAAEPKLAAELNGQHRYNAACSAALAAAGQGEDARLLPDKVVCMFRRWALGWLRDDLTAYAKRAQQNNPALKQTIQQRLTHWRRDSDLASVREPAALDRLPENERAAWQALWRDRDELAQRVATKSN
jgi:tetratricopeptide (TPR) repeat protein